MSDSFLSVDFNSSIDEESKFISCHAIISLINIENGNETNIGGACLYFINVYQYEDWSNVICRADSISGDMSSITYSLTNIIEEENDFFGLLAVVDSITIDKKYRGIGYGTEAFKEIIKYLEILSIDYIALQPFPFEEESEVKKISSIQKLVKFYKELEFNIVNKVSETQLIMGRNLNHL